MTIFKENDRCLICGNQQLEPVIRLGEMALSGVFPKEHPERVPHVPLALVKCCEKPDGSSCGLLQLQHICDLNVLYGDHYGYRSGLNKTMIAHLQGITRKIEQRVELREGDLIIDIGSNDGTLLKSYSKPGLRRLGIDPAGNKFQAFYPKDIGLLTGFFGADLVRRHIGPQPAKVITSIAMFYDLEAPLAFMAQIYDLLDEQGIWVFEQSYMPLMLQRNAYDTICHEHLSYYGLRQIQWMTERIGFRIIDLELNDINGGSFRVTVCKKGGTWATIGEKANRQIAFEKSLQLDTLAPYEAFKRRTMEHRRRIRKFFAEMHATKKVVLGCGASTKGNIILQYCGVTREDMPCIAEVNEDKFGAFTPGTGIPIVPERLAHEQNPDFMLVLPWAFRLSIAEREAAFLSRGGGLVFPLPVFEVVTQQRRHMRKPHAA
jgi:NDP-4-keto-2,6-dideoxyhexose 3-C-methyltransferase